MRRLESALPLLAAYFGLAALYAWQAWQRQTLTLFSDEIEFTQVSRSIADTGRAALRGGEPALEWALYPYLAAPAWWLDDVSDAFGAVKLLGVLLMTSAIFPAYGLARLVVPRSYALFAAVATGAAPALSYSPFLVDEPLAYPVSTLTLYLIARAGLRPTRGSAALAVAGCAAAFLVRSQLAVLLVVALLVFAARAWRNERVRGWRRTWTGGDWVGAITLTLGLAVAASALIGHRSNTWYVSTGFFKERMLDYGLWAAGALAIGVGVLPLIGALAALVRPRGEVPDPGRRVFADLSIASFAAFGLYTAVKAAFISTTLAIVVAERNLMYLYPLLFAGTALLLHRRRVSVWALAAATGLALYLVTSTPYTLAQYPNYEAHGLAIAAFANRILKWPGDTIETTLVLITLGSAAVLLALRFARPRVAGPVVAVLAVVMLAWSLTTEIYAANGERYASDQIYANLPKPPDWIERTADGASTVYIGQGIDAFAAWQVEFWNPNVRWFWGMDGSAPGPGARTTPDLARPDGTQAPTDLGANYAVAVNGVQIAAPVVTKAGGSVLYRLDGRPVQLVDTTAGISPDGWMGSSASYTRYDVGEDTARLVTVQFSREAACFPSLKPVRVEARIGPVAVDPKTHQPVIGEVTATRSGTLEACKATGLLLRVPRQSWRIEATVAETFVPRELDSNLGDARALGARVTFALRERT